MSNPATYEGTTSIFGATDLIVSWTSTGASAVPTTPAGYTIYNQNVKSVTRTGAGQYVIAFNQPFLNLLQWNIGVVQATFDTTKAYYGVITVDNCSNAASPSVTVQFLNNAGATTQENLAGDKLYLYMGFRYKKA
jgi:hypothetical protein